MRTLVLLAVSALGLHAQAHEVFKLDFTIRDSGDAGGKTGRKYSLLVNDKNKSTFKIGNRVPMTTGTTGSFGANTQYTYVDVGVNIDCTVQQIESKVGMRASLDFSTAVTNDKSSAAAPTISQIKVDIETAVTPGKPTVVASFDDPVTSRKFEVEVTATKVN